MIFIHLLTKAVTNHFMRGYLSFVNLVNLQL